MRSMLLLLLVLVLVVEISSAWAPSIGGERAKHVRGLIDDLEGAVSSFTKDKQCPRVEKDIVEACLCIYKALPPSEPTTSVLCNYKHFFDAQLWDESSDALKFAFDMEKEEKIRESLVLEATGAILASARFLLMPEHQKQKVLDALHATISSNEFLTARAIAIEQAQKKSRGLDMNADAAVANDDMRIVDALYQCTAKYVGPTVLSPNGFPSTKLGLRSLAAVGRACSNQGFSAAFDRVWHAAREAGPIITDTTSNTKDTLIVAFSSLGWSGVMRPEWGATIRAAPQDIDIDIAYALDTSQSWFSTNPMTGSFDGGAWWDSELYDLCSPYSRVCFIGESMGGSGALRFARHCTDSVVALVPQINLEEFSSPIRADFTSTRISDLREKIDSACQETQARIVLHVGRQEEDLSQLNYLSLIVDAHRALDQEVDLPLVRDGDEDCLTVGNNSMRLVKHDIEGHAVGMGLKKQGLLQEIILNDLLDSESWSDSSEPQMWRGKR